MRFFPLSPQSNLSLASGHRLPFSSALPLTRYLPLFETGAAAPWSAALSALYYIEGIFYGMDSYEDLQVRFCFKKNTSTLGK